MSAEETAEGKSMRGKLLVKRLSPYASLPSYSHPGDAGLDLTAVERVTIPIGQRRLISTGLSIELPKSTEGQIRPRSGLAFQHGITVLNSPGTIDQGFRGELKVLLVNLGEKDFVVERGTKIAQLVVGKVVQLDVLEATELSDSARGSGGFGSTDGR